MECFEISNAVRKGMPLYISLKIMQYLDSGRPPLIFLTAKTEEETLTMTHSSPRKVESSRKVQYSNLPRSLSFKALTGYMKLAKLLRPK